MKGSIRGNGRIFPRGSWWWAAYYINGQERRESTGIRIEEKNADKRALTFLRSKTREAGAAHLGLTTVPTSKARRITVGELLDALQADFALRAIASQQNLANLKRARKDFGHLRAAGLTSEAVDKYIEERLADGDAKASINRVTQLLGQGYRLAIQRKHLNTAPLIRHLSEKGNERTGFFEAAQFRAVVATLPDDIRDFCRFGYLVGWRKGEITSLTWTDIDGDTIRLRAENAKNGCARSVPIEGELEEIIDRRRAARVVKKGDTATLVALVFHRDGEPVGDIRKSWATACRLAGVSGKLFHDFRRTAVRDMVRAGVPETVAMSISGHKTRSVFDRYNITDERDQREALQATEHYRQQQAEQQAATRLQ